MKNNYIKKISTLLSISEIQIQNVIELLEGGATIPFISRYRKEQTGGLDEVQIENIKNKNEELIEFDKRKKYILEAIDKQGKLTDELRDEINAIQELTKLEDLYLPYKVKKKTKAEKARKKGLEPLAETVFDQKNIDLQIEAKKYLSEEVETIEDALEGARDIIAEWVNEDAEVREKIRTLFENRASIKSSVIKTKKEEASKFKDYFNSSELLRECPSHRLLAMRRGESEGFLRISIAPPEEVALGILNKIFVVAENDLSEQVKLAVEDSYKRLLGKSIESEFAKLSKEKADEEAIRVFVTNLSQLLLAAPLGQKNVLALDPGFRTGCKTVVLDNQGNLIMHTVVYPMGNSIVESTKIIRNLVEKYKVEAIAIGNGTASRETEDFVRKIEFGSTVDIFVISEDGASIYSASKIAREEFPDKDVTVRGAVSIGRRLMDPLAELVKLDAKSIGVGQYQHDVDQPKLKKSLDQTVENCVNQVGVNLNTASKHILTYISGLGPTLAQNIVDYRKENGLFNSRKQIKKVKKLGPKAFEQAAGFLRIQDAKNPLDNSAVHPESYKIVEKMAKDIGSSVDQLIGNNELLEKIDLNTYITEEVGLPTLKDIIEELEKPGRDPRGEVEIFKFEDGINDIKDLEEGMILPGLVTNITNFGAFVDVGVHCDGLVHVSQMADRFIKDPNDVVTLQQKVKVKVTEIDMDRKRIALSMKNIG